MGCNIKQCRQKRRCNGKRRNTVIFLFLAFPAGLPFGHVHFMLFLLDLQLCFLDLELCCFFLAIDRFLSDLIGFGIALNNLSHERCVCQHGVRFDLFRWNPQLFGK